jgi:tripartite-type tricarboxylate transporter receptor subunit TctC
VRAAPDGYTLLLVGLPNAINATLYKKLNFNFIREIPPVASIGGAPYVMVVNPSVPANTGVHRLRQGEFGQHQYGHQQAGLQALSSSHQVQCEVRPALSACCEPAHG